MEVDDATRSASLPSFSSLSLVLLYQNKREVRWILLTMNPGVSLQVTGVFPISLQISKSAEEVSGAVWGVEMISTSFICESGRTRETKGELGV